MRDPNASSNGHLQSRRDVGDEELLGRIPIRLSEPLIRGAIEGKTLLVTGAAGSIGSGLCRQIARFKPAAIVGFDMAETPLFEIDLEMRSAFPEVRFHPEIGNIQNRARLNEVFRRYAPSACYHAAAYKHVPLMEEHIFEAVENNIFGTANLIDAAEHHAVREFVLISTDKAVRPTSMMGASKRVAEMLLARGTTDTRFIAVRFGNVLGSTGSVLPIFKRQIAAGGPITVTHPEMRRFFMTIAEACQLVLQASSLAGQAQICVLDMGEQIRILDLAHRLIRLSGLEPEKDIRVEFTGIRPGEKISEELSTLLEDTVPTSLDHVRLLASSSAPSAEVWKRIESLHAICGERDTPALLEALREILPDYTPSENLLRRIRPDALSA